MKKFTLDENVSKSLNKISKLLKVDNKKALATCISVLELCTQDDFKELLLFKENGELYVSKISG